MGVMSEIEFENERNRSDFGHCDLLLIISTFILRLCTNLLSLSGHI